MTGNVTALRNPLGVEDVLGRAYRETATVVAGIPTRKRHRAALLDRVPPVHAVVPVDHFLPGCPPPADAIHRVRARTCSPDARRRPRELRFG